MRYSIAYVLLFCLFWGIKSLSAQISIPSPFPMAIHTDVDSSLIRQLKVREIKVFRSNSAADKTSEQQYTQRFDIHGRLLSMKGCYFRDNDVCADKSDFKYYYRPDGQISEIISQYFAQGKLIYDSISFDYNAGKLYIIYDFSTVINESSPDTTHGFSRIEYDSIHHVITHIRQEYPDMSHNREAYKLDSAGRILSAIYTNEKGITVLGWKIKYNSLGKIIDYQTIENQEQDFREHNEYDKKGNNIRSLQYDGQDTLMTTIIRKYDAKNRLIDDYRETLGQAVGTVFQYRYDKQGKVSELIGTQADKTPVFRHKYFYLENGLPEHEEFYDRDTEPRYYLRYSYQYY